MIHTNDNVTYSQDLMTLCKQYMAQCNCPIDGQLHRFSRDHKKREKDEWYIGSQGISKLGNSYLTVTFGSWSDGQKYCYKSWNENGPMDAQEREQLQRLFEKQRKDSEKKLKQERENAARKAQGIWESISSKPPLATAWLPETYLRYVKSKGIDPVGVRFGDNPNQYPAIVIPFRNGRGEIRTLEYISVGDDGKSYKTWLTGGEKKGHFFALGDIEPNKPLYVAEGYATAVSCYNATGEPTVMAGDSGNLDPVINTLLNIYKGIRITIVGDTDEAGREKAEKAAKKYGCEVVFPVFPSGKDKDKNGEYYTDFNDLQQVCGTDEVKKQLGNPLRDGDTQSKNEDLKNINPDQADEVIIDGVPKKVTDMRSLDDRFAQLEAPGQPCVIINRGDAQPITVSDFKSRISGEVVVVSNDENGNPKYMSASKYWQGNARKRILRKIAFTNQPVDDSTYNLFSGFGVRPAKGNCNLILNHIKEVICAGCETSHDALVKLLAWQLQNIGKPSRIITALKSTVQQVGKGCLASDILAKIYGNAGFATSDIGQITGRFNDNIRGKAYLFLDEALFSGDRKAADAIKSWAACSRTGIETKGLPIVQVPIGVNFFLATNHEDAAFIEEEDARYWILEVSPHRAGDTGYFNDLYQEINNGGLEAFMHHLLSLDVSAFIPSRDVPKNNAAKAAMIHSSINQYDARKWLEECCRAELILGYKPVDKDSKFQWERWNTDSEYSNSIFATAYTEWQKGVKSPVAPRPTPSNKFGELLNKVGMEMRIMNGQRWRRLPDPEECLKLIAEAGKKL